MKANSVIHELSFRFSLDIIRLYQQMLLKKEFIISKQLLRSGTSVGANIEEASAAQSKRDFVAKIAIASKEAREVKYWLRLLDQSDLVDINVKEYLCKIDDIINILTKIVKTTQDNIRAEQNVA